MRVFELNLTYHQTCVLGPLKKQLVFWAKLGDWSRNPYRYFGFNFSKQTIIWSIVLLILNFWYYLVCKLFSIKPTKWIHTRDNWSKRCPQTVCMSKYRTRSNPGKWAHIYSSQANYVLYSLYVHGTGMAYQFIIIYIYLFWKDMGSSFFQPQASSNHKLLHGV